MSASEALPVFRYHPDPLATGSIVDDADTPCLACSRIRGYIYAGPVYTDKNFILDNHLCPWCIADGSAARRFAATFTDAGQTEGIDDSLRDELETRTPGFTAWQKEQWLSCCGDAAAFLGLAGARELQQDFPAAIPVVKRYLRHEYELSKEEADELFALLRKTDQPTSYLFRCLHCNKYLTYIDQT